MMRSHRLLRFPSVGIAEPGLHSAGDADGRRPGVVADYWRAEAERQCTPRLYTILRRELSQTH